MISAFDGYHGSTKEINGVETLPSTVSERRLPATAGSPGFEAVMARLTPATRAAVVEKIQTVDSARVKELESALEAAELSAPIFRDPDLTLYTHAALFNGAITTLQFATVQRFSMALERRGGADAEYEVHHLFDERGEVNSATLEMLRKTWSENVPRKESATGAQEAEKIDDLDAWARARMVELQKNQCQLNADEEKIFLALVQKLPPSEKQVILVQDLEPRRGTIPKGQTISTAINQETGVNVFCRLDHEDSPKRMIASTGVMQAYLTASDRKVRINPVVGPSDRSAIHTGLEEGYHDMRLAGIPGITDALPQEVIGYRAQGEDFPWHDFYHCVRQGNIPADQMGMHLSLADALLSEIRKSTGVEGLYEAIIDVDYPAYSPGTTEMLGSSANHKYWTTLQQMIVKSITAQAAKEGNLPFVDRYAQEFAEGPVPSLVAKAILANHKEWAKKGVTLEGFLRFTDEIQKNVNAIVESTSRDESKRYLLPPLNTRLKKQLEYATGILPVAEKLKELVLRQQQRA